MFTKYREYGLALMPLVPNTKDAGVPQWQRFSTQLPDDRICDVWKKIKNPNYGLVCGKASNVIAVDVDTQKPDVIASIPQSPLRKAGNPLRETRFFQYNADLQFNRHILCGDNERVEIISDGGYTVLPPSIHPVTGKPYFWLTPDTFPAFSSKDLPVLTQEDINRIITACSKYEVSGDSSEGVDLHGGPWVNTDTDRLSPHGSQARLRKLASGLVNGDLTDKDIAERLVDYDNKNHLPVGYFTEHGRTSDQKSKNPMDNALMFTMNIRKSINQRRLANGESPLVGSTQGELVVYQEKDVKTTDLTIKLPEPTGLLKEIMDAILESSPMPQPQFALAGALGLMSVICANRFEMNGIRTNLYLMNLGRTGSGKDAPKKLCTGVLQHDEMRKHNLLGITKYVSAPATILQLPEQRQRLDIVDEFSGFLKALSRRDSLIYQVATELTELWSINGGYYGGIKSVGRGDQTGACYSPSISILGFCQPDTFIGNVTREILDVGFLPRFLVFQAKNENYCNEDFLEVDTRAIIHRITQRVLEMFKPVEIPSCTDGKIQFDAHIAAHHVVTETASKNRFKDLFVYYANKTDSIDNEYKRAVTSRAFENIVKLSIINAVSSGRDVVSAVDLDFSKALVDALIYNSTDLAIQVSASGDRDRNVDRLVRMFDRKNIVTMDEIRNNIRNTTRAQREDMIRDLVDSGIIEPSHLGKKKAFKRVDAEQR